MVLAFNKKSTLIESLVATQKLKITQTLTMNTDYDTYTFPQLQELLQDSPKGGDFVDSGDALYVIVCLHPVFDAENGRIPVMYESEMSFYDESGEQMDYETMDFHLAEERYEENDVEITNDADDTKLVGIDATFQVSPIMSKDFSEDLMDLSPVYLSVGGPIYSSISGSILDAFDLLNINPDDPNVRPVKLVFVVPDIQYVHGNEPNRLAKDIVALAEAEAYKYMELKNSTRLDITTGVIWLRKPGTITNINSYVEKKKKKKDKKKNKKKDK